MAPAEVVHVLRPARGGMRGHVLALVAGLDRARFHPVVAGPLDAELRDTLARLGVETVAVPVPGRPGPGLLAATRRLRAVFAERRPEVVHCHGLAAALVGRMAAGPAARLDPASRHPPAVVVTVHNLPNWPPSRLRRLMNRAIERRLGPRVSRYIAVSAAVRDALVEDVLVRPERVAVIHSAVDLTAWLPADAEEQAAARAGLALPAGAPVVGMLARLAPEKGPDLLLHAFAGMARGFPSTHAGDAEEVSPPLLAFAGDGPMRGTLEHEARRAGVADRVRFFGRLGDPRAFVAAVDVLAAPSRAEGLGMACLEAFARGRPAVAFAVGGLREVVRDGDDGFLVPPGDPDAFGAALGRLLGDRDLARRMGQRGREEVERRFGLDRMVEETEHLYEAVAGEAGRSSRPRGRIPS